MVDNQGFGVCLIGPETDTVLHVSTQRAVVPMFLQVSQAIQIDMEAALVQSFVHKTHRSPSVLTEFRRGDLMGLSVS